MRLVLSSFALAARVANGILIRLALDFHVLIVETLQGACLTGLPIKEKAGLAACALSNVVCTVKTRMLAVQF